MCAKQAEYMLLPGRLWPNTPSGAAIEIEVFGATGEFQSGKSLLGLSIAPGKHPAGHAFEGQPRTLYCDLEKSGATYGGTGCNRIDVPAEMAKIYGNTWTARQLAEWFVKLPTVVKPGQYDVIHVDPINDVESGIVDLVKSNPQAHGYSKAQMDNSTALLMAAMKAYWKRTLMEFSRVCKTFFFTTHLRDEFKGGKPTGRREARGKETLYELASLYLWLERKPDEKGNLPQVPSAICVPPYGKHRLADTSINEETGELITVDLLPPRIPVATVAAIRGYIANPPNYGKLKESERVIEEKETEADMERLKMARAQAESEAANAKMALVDRQEKLTAIRQAAQTSPSTLPVTQTTPVTHKEPTPTDAEISRMKADSDAKLAIAKQSEEKLMAGVEGSHAEARDAGQQTQQGKAATTEKVDRFKALCAASKVSMPRLKSAIDPRGGKFTSMTAENQDAVLNWLQTLADCQGLVVDLGLDDAKVKGMLARAGVQEIEGLSMELLGKFRESLTKAKAARAGSGGN